jgi:D-threo-aldose 1-dehydrogenase
VTVTRLQPDNRVGQTDLHIAGIGLGTASIGTLYSTVSEAQAVETVQFALAHGVNYFDTAPFYSERLCETRLGLALTGVSRDSYVLSTKVGRPDGTNDIDFSADAVKRSIEGSLRRLCTDRVDILLIHDPSLETYRAAMNEAYPVLADLHRQGVIKAVGVGMNYWELLTDFARDGDFDCFILAGRYTLLEQSALNALNQFAAKGISVLAAGVYNSGVLTNGTWYQYAPPPPAIVQRVNQLRAICDKFAVALPVAALRFVSAHPAVTSLILGCESADQLAQNMARLSTPVPPEFWQALVAEGLLDPAAPVPQ